VGLEGLGQLKKLISENINRNNAQIRKLKFVQEIKDTLVTRICVF
jgi:hypothetical protein